MARTGKIGNSFVYGMNKRVNEMPAAVVRILTNLNPAPNLSPSPLLPPHEHTKLSQPPPLLHPTSFYLPPGYGILYHLGYCKSN